MGKEKMALEYGGKWSGMIVFKLVVVYDFCNDGTIYNHVDVISYNSNDLANNSRTRLHVDGAKLKDVVSNELNVI